MRLVLPALAVAGALAATVAGCAAPATGSMPSAARSRPPASYYLSLGDSLAAGVQPDSSGASVRTPDGYADQLYLALRRRDPGLRMVDLGCPGETTASMIDGGICSYPGGSQLAAAVRFLGAHRGHVSLVTMDIGANDPGSCISQAGAVALAACAVRSVPQAAANLATILARIRRVAPGVRMIAMNYYLPALSEWRDGLAGHVLARLLELATAGYNTLLTHVYQSYGVPVANVFSAFRSADFAGQVTLPELGPLPPNVAAICQWTWECAAPPRGPNEHPNEAGYALIAGAFLRAGGRLPGPARPAH